MVDIWSVPGARRWAAPIRTALKRGTCVIVCHPTGARPRGLVEQVAAWCSEARPILHRLQVDPMLAAGDRGRNGELLARDVAASLGLTHPAGTRIYPVDVAADERTDQALIHIDARAVPDDVAGNWCSFAAAIASGTKEIAPSDRAPVIVHVAGAGVELPNSGPNLKVLWWWGALSPLDITVMLDDPSRDEVTAASIVEVARWDLNLAETLATRWDGDPLKLPGHLAAASPADDGLSAADLIGPAGPTPSSLRAPWAAGRVDAWGGRTDPHASLLLPAEVDRRRWHAQVRVVYPWLEELRAEISCSVLDCAANAGLPEETLDELGAYELGPLRHHAVFQLKLKVPVPVLDVLNRAVTARNALAHIEPVDPVTLASLASAAQKARFAPGPVRSP